MIHIENTFCNYFNKHNILQNPLQKQHWHFSLWLLFTCCYFFFFGGGGRTTTNTLDTTMTPGYSPFCQISCQEDLCHSKTRCTAFTGEWLSEDFLKGVIDLDRFVFSQEAQVLKDPSYLQLPSRSLDKNSWNMPYRPLSEAPPQKK